jgi:LPXTG-motif cell wall-anchored protein
MMKRLVLALGVAVALLFGAAPAGADGYPPAEPGPPAAVVPTQPPSGALPVTGDDSSLPMARAGAALLAGGGVLVLAARRRRGGLASA